MSSRRTRCLIVALALALATGSLAQVQNRPDLDAIYRIKEEAFQRSQLMEMVSYLTDVYGPRLTGSPNVKAAADYVIGRLTAWGMQNPRLESWGPFGPGWSNDRFVALAVSPQSYPLIAYPKAWTPGTQGTVTAEALMARIESESDFQTYRGKLRGKFVLTTAMREARAQFEALGRRYSDDDLSNLAKQAVPRPQFDPEGPPARPQQEVARKRMQFFLDEGVVALLEPGRGDGGTVFVGDGRLRDQAAPVAPQVVLAVEHYNRIARTLEKNIPVTLEMNIRNTFHAADTNSFNIVAELPGSDKAPQIVMLGAHFDSWHAGTGATDNAAGSAVMLEAMRILKVAGLPVRRTVRLALWTGEEQGLRGSRAYVTQHFADRATMQLKPEHAALSAYFNVDNGTGAIRGVYLQGNEAVAPIFESWTDPFKNLGMTTLSIRSTGSTDHLSFDAVGLPGFQFIQDPIEYGTRTHHSNMDVYDRLQSADLIQNAVIVASFVYHAANREDQLPRKPLPKPQAPAPTTQSSVGR
jgi:hypothetical protein